MDGPLLGAPISPGRTMDRALSVTCCDLARAFICLKLLSSHDALVIMKLSPSSPKLLCSLPSSHCSDHPKPEQFDALLGYGFSSFSNISLYDVKWIQASFLVGDGGLWICSSALRGPSALVAFAAGNRDLQFTSSRLTHYKKIRGSVTLSKFGLHDIQRRNLRLRLHILRGVASGLPSSMHPPSCSSMPRLIVTGSDSSL